LVDRGWPKIGRVTAHRTAFGLRGLPVPAGGDLARGLVVPAVWLSYRDAGELMAERGIAVDHVTIYQWEQRFTPEFIEAARPCRRPPGDRWFADEIYMKVAGAWTYLCRAVDQYGQVIDVLPSGRRDLGAARRFFTLWGSRNLAGL
jgi:transposase-like protein